MAGTVYSNCSTLGGGCSLFYDTCFSSPAGPGYFSDGNYCYQTNSSGYIISVTSVTNWHVFYNCDYGRYLLFCGSYPGGCIYVSGWGCAYVVAANTNFSTATSYSPGTNVTGTYMYYDSGCCGPCV